MKNFPIQHTFRALRNLPLEISLEQIENWLQQQDLTKLKKKKSRPNWLNKLLSNFSKN